MLRAFLKNTISMAPSLLSILEHPVFKDQPAIQAAFFTRHVKFVPEFSMFTRLANGEVWKHHPGSYVRGPLVPKLKSAFKLPANSIPPRSALDWNPCYQHKTVQPTWPELGNPHWQWKCKMEILLHNLRMVTMAPGSRTRNSLVGDLPMPVSYLVHHNMLESPCVDSYFSHQTASIHLLSSTGRRLRCHDNRHIHDFALPDEAWQLTGLWAEKWRWRQIEKSLPLVTKALDAEEARLNALHRKRHLELEEECDKKTRKFRAWRGTYGPQQYTA